ncbi:hypothetical protein G6F68_016611 [Rhizopus microsporus]|nr:hypothetical protein G6F68_016611 [Rhizopus microsporus]
MPTSRPASSERSPSPVRNTLNAGEPKPYLYSRVTMVSDFPPPTQLLASAQHSSSVTPRSAMSSSTGLPTQLKSPHQFSDPDSDTVRGAGVQ